MTLWQNMYCPHPEGLEATGLAGILCRPCDESHCCIIFRRRLHGDLPPFCAFTEVLPRDWLCHASSSTGRAAYFAARDWLDALRYLRCAAQQSAASLLMMPLLRRKLMRSPSVQKGTNSGKEVDILRSIQMRGIGLSGPCKTPDFVPASIYLRGQKSDQDIGLEDTTMTDSLLDFSTAPASAPSSPIRIPNGGTHLVDFEVKLRRGRKGLGLRLVGGAEEGTQVKMIT